jgi:ABC-type multidrug transport system ATPase subunit
LQRAREGMTVLVISHRTSTLLFCDDAVVLHRGHVVNTGPLSSALEYYGAQSTRSFESDAVESRV